MSIAVLLFGASFANLLYHLVGVSRPLSTIPLVITFTVISIVLHLIAYTRAPGQRELMSNVPAQLHQLKNSVDPFLLFPVLFPFLAIFGTSLMNGYGNNLVLIILILLIACYTVALLYFRNRVSPVVFPAAVFLISVAMLLKDGLTSYYLTGGDAQIEFQAFQRTADAASWSSIAAVPAYNITLSLYNSTLSVSLFPTVLNALLNIDPLYIFKACGPLILAPSAVCVYIIARRYLDNTRAFLASLLFVFQLVFIEAGGGNGYLALLFCALAFLVLIDDIEEHSQRVLSFLLLLVFAVCIILSHYSTAYVFIIVLFVTWALSASLRHLFRIKTAKYSLSLPLIFILSAVAFLWYGQLTGTSFSQGVSYLHQSFTALMDIIGKESTQQQALSGLGTTYVSPTAQWIRSAAMYTTFAFIGVGTLYVLKNIKRNFNEYFLLLLAGMILSVMWVTIPSLGVFGISRLIQILLIFLAPAFFFGLEFVFKSLSVPRLAPAIAIVLVLVLIVSNTYLTDTLLGAQPSIDLSNGGLIRDSNIVNPSEAAGARWFASYRQIRTTVGTDFFGATSLCMSPGSQAFQDVWFFFNSFYNNNGTSYAYIYLHQTNVNGFIYLTGISTSGHKEPPQYVPIASFSHLFNGTSRIYDSGGVEVFKR